MKKSNFNQNLHAIVVGSSTDEFIYYTLKVLSNYEVDFVVCENVYPAVGHLARNTGRNVLVIGRFGQLNREKGRFFHIAGEKGSLCCCLAEACSAQNQKAAAGTGIFFINEAAEIKGVVEKLLAKSLSCSPENNRTSFSVKKDFPVTKAELDALLGV